MKTKAPARMSMSSGSIAKSVTINTKTPTEIDRWGTTFTALYKEPDERQETEKENETTLAPASPRNRTRKGEGREESIIIDGRQMELTNKSIKRH